MPNSTESRLFKARHQQMLLSFIVDKPAQLVDIYQDMPFVEQLRVHIKSLTEAQCTKLYAGFDVEVDELNYKLISITEYFNGN